jgi:hypothetical protein
VFGVHLVITVWFPYWRWFLLVILDLTGTIAVWAILTSHLPSHGHYNVDKPSLPGTYHVELSPRFFEPNSTA